MWLKLITIRSVVVSHSQLKTKMDISMFLAFGYTLYSVKNLLKPFFIKLISFSSMIETLVIVELLRKYPKCLVAI